MVNFGFHITAKNSSTNNIVFRVNIDEWHELLFTLCPNFTGFTHKLKFNREDVLSGDEIELLENISYDEQAVSISEGYEEYKEPSFSNAKNWVNIFTKIELTYFKSEKIDYINEIQTSKNDEKEISKTIRKIRSRQYYFDQFKQTLNIAKENNFDIALTISDY